MTGNDIRTAEIGHVFRGTPRALTLSRTLAFSGGPFDTPGWPARNLHTDLAVAQETGLAKVVASGTQFEGYLASHLVRICGRCWHDAGSWEVRIVRSVAVNDTVTPVARLISRADNGDGTALELEVWCENQDGENVLTGTARCVLPPAQ